MAKAKSTRNTKKNGNSTEVPTSPEVRANVIPINLEEEIRRRAYQIFEERGAAPGSENEDWLRAEREILGRYQQSA